MIDLLNILSALFVLSALFAYVNYKLLKLPPTIGLMILGLLLSIVLQVLGFISPEVVHFSKQLLERVDFPRLVFDVMLSFLLFAGALHIDISQMKKAKWSIISFATVGVIMSTLIVGTSFWLGLRLFDLSVDYIYCLLFGALISPTDPIAVLGIMKKSKVPESLEVKITGESLFNDGIGVVLFIILFQFASQNEAMDFKEVMVLLLEEVGGGMGLGFLLGYSGVRLLKTIDHYQTEVMITIAMVMGGYSLAGLLHFSGPLAVVIAGLFVGNKGRKTAMSNTTVDYLNKFWEMVDEILNAGLFVLIGLELLIIPFNWKLIAIGLMAVVMVLAARYIALALLSRLTSFQKAFSHASLLFLTWAGLKGGISIAMALSLQQEMEKSLIVTTTYNVVLFSILAQGLTLQWVIKKLLKGEMQENKKSRH